MRVVPEKQEPDGPSPTELLIRFILVFVMGVLLGWILFNK